MFDIYDVMFEIHIDGNLAQKQTMRVPKEFLMANFVQTAQQIRNDPRSITLKMIHPVTIWDPFEQKYKVLNNGITLTNNIPEGNS